MTQRTAIVALLGLVALLGVRAGVPDDVRRLLARASGDDASAFVPDEVYLEHRARWALSWEDSADVVFLGDSHIAIADWDELLAHEIAERGIGGDVVPGVRNRLADALALEPKAVVVMAGYNDLASRRSPREVAVELEDVAAQLHEGGVPRVLLVSLLPVEADHRLAERVNPAAREVNAAVRVVADRTSGVELVDLASAVAPEGALDPALSMDGVHLRAAGYAILRDLLLEQLEAELSPAPDAAP
jgi:lysophospholipase L1-like esterase